jgi:hypothetical protein
MALSRAWRAQAAQVSGAIYVLALEGALRHAEEYGRARDIVLRQVDETFTLATGSAAGLALESHAAIVYRARITQLYASLPTRREWRPSNVAEERKGF